MPVGWAGRGSSQVCLGPAGEFRAKVATPREQDLGRLILGTIVRRGCAVVFLLASITKRQPALLKTESQQTAAYAVALGKSYGATS